MEEVYDQFPINLLETGGKIAREPFGFMVHTINIWENQHRIINQRIDGVIKGTITNQEMHIELRNIDFNQYISNNLVFSEISLNSKHSKKCTFYTLRFGCSFAAVNTIKPQLL